MPASSKTLARSAARPRHVALTRTFVVERWMGPSRTARAAARARGDKPPALRQLESFTVDARTVKRAETAARAQLSGVGVRSLLWLTPSKMRAIIESDRLPQTSIVIPPLGKRRGARVRIADTLSTDRSNERSARRTERRASRKETRDRAQTDGQ